MRLRNIRIKNFRLLTDVQFQLEDATTVIVGRPVIYTCRNGELGKAHFDTRHYNHIGWDTPEDLREKLKRRVEATIAP